MASEWTEEHLSKLKDQIAQGLLSVEYEDRKMTFRSLNDMLKLKRLMEEEINGRKKDDHYYPIYESGL